MKRFAMIIITVLLLVTFSVGMAESNPTISFSEPNYVLTVGKTLTLKATIQPKNMKLEWFSSNEAVATVSSKGIVKGLSAGEADITVRSVDDNGIRAICTVNVVVPVKKLSLSEKTVQLAVDTTWKVDGIIEPDNATNKTISWSSSNEKVATVNENGVIYGVADGSAKVTAVTQDGNKKATVDVKVGSYDVVIKTPAEVEVDDLEYYEGRSAKGCVVIEDKTWLKPVKAGEDTVSYDSFSHFSGKTVTYNISVYVAQTAIPGNNSFSSKASEDEKAKGMISFRGIPWESSVSESLDKLRESSSYMSTTSEAWLTSEQFVNWPEQVPVIRMGIQISGLSVAGFPAEQNSDGTNIILYFLPKVSADQNSYSSKEGVLVAAEYYCIGRIKDLEWSEVKKEISKKLSTLYGEQEDDYWQKDDACLAIGEVSHDEKVVDKYKQAQRLMSNNPGPMEFTTSSIMDGYSLTYSFWSEAVSKQANIILNIDKQEAKRKQDKWEQEREEEKRREEEEKEAEEEARGYDGL